MGQEEPKPILEGIEPWMDEEEIKGLKHVQQIRDSVAAAHGLMAPFENQRALGWMTHYYERATERAAKFKAMRDEYFSSTLITYPGLAVSRAKAMAEGSEFGRKRTYYKNQAEGYLEMVNTFKKNIEYYDGVARKQW